MDATQLPDESVLDATRGHMPCVCYLEHLDSGIRFPLYEGVNRVGRAPSDAPARSAIAAHGASNSAAASRDAAVRFVRLGDLHDADLASIHRSHFDIDIRAVRGAVDSVGIFVRTLPRTTVPVFVLARDGSGKVDCELQASTLAHVEADQVLSIPSAHGAAVRFCVRVHPHAPAHMRSEHARVIDDTEMVNTQPSMPADTRTAARGGAAKRAHASSPQQGRSTPALSAQVTEPHAAMARAAIATLVADEEESHAPPFLVEATQVAVYEATQAAEEHDADAGEAAEHATQPTPSVRKGLGHRLLGSAARRGRGGRSSEKRPIVVKKLDSSDDIASLENAFSIGDLPYATLPTQVEYSPARPSPPAHAPQPARRESTPSPIPVRSSASAESAAGDHSQALGASGGSSSPTLGSDDGEAEIDAPATSGAHMQNPPATRRQEVETQDGVEDIPLAVLRARQPQVKQQVLDRVTETEAITSPSVTESQMERAHAAVDQAMRLISAPPARSSDIGSHMDVNAPAPATSPALGNQGHPILLSPETVRPKAASRRPPASGSASTRATTVQSDDPDALEHPAAPAPATAGAKRRRGDPDEADAAVHVTSKQATAVAPAAASEAEEHAASRKRGRPASKPAVAVVTETPPESTPAVAAPKAGKARNTGAVSDAPLRGCTIAFTGLADTGPMSRAKMEALARKLGAAIGDPDKDIATITHLVAPRLMTTPKFLKAVCAIQFIVLPTWIEQCDKQSRRLSELEFTPAPSADNAPALQRTDVRAALLARGTLPIKPLKEGLFLLLSDVKDEKIDVLRDVIEFAGGAVVANLDAAKAAKRRAEVVIALAAAENMTAATPSVKKCLEAGIQVCNRHLVGTAVIHQELIPSDIEAHALSRAPGAGRKGK